LPASAGEPAPVRGARRVRPAAAAAALALAVVVALVAWSRSAGAGQVVDLPARSPVATVAAPAGPSGVLLTGPATPAPSRAAGLVVDVEGRVRRPGLVRLPAGSRVADAVRAAGGAAPGAVLARLNLARLLADGEQLLVPGPGDTPLPAASGSGAASGGPSAPLDLNAATQEGLDALPGVGPVLAARIVAWRTQHGRFTSVDELGEVPGIGPKALERLRPLVRV
jgi:competence protein ComEA